MSSRLENDGHARQGSVKAAVGVAEVPDSALALTSLPVIDYADQFTLSTNLRATPEQWARAMFGDVPSIAERFIWQALLGLRLLPGPSRSAVAGWRIADGGSDWIRLEASGPMVGNLVVRTASGQVSLTTLIHYVRGRGRMVWPRLSAVHRLLAPGLLRDAATAIATHPEPAGTAYPKV
ncbi:hypothetical protein ACFXHA_02145 [Nocardia sp. NPDC059240]|uniref:hypothetical protein n=1 Tax=Nocardia sp. NPDC059240 TaxID=3346786 RepID=UPI0036D12AC6